MERQRIMKMDRVCRLSARTHTCCAYRVADHPHIEVRVHVNRSDPSDSFRQVFLMDRDEVTDYGTVRAAIQASGRQRKREKSVLRKAGTVNHPTAQVRAGKTRRTPAARPRPGALL